MTNIRSALVLPVGINDITGGLGAEHALVSGSVSRQSARIVDDAKADATLSSRDSAVGGFDVRSENERVITKRGIINLQSMVCLT